ncbi:hypothetical protein [Nocardia gipuzkoensis]
MTDSWPLLTNDRLNGMYRVRRFLRPPNIAQAVAKDDFSQAVIMVKKLCCTWGGAYTPIVPVEHSGPVDPLWVDILDRSPLDALNDRGLSLNIPGQFGYSFRGNGRGVDLLDALVLLPQVPDHKPVMVASGILDSDPWYLSYLATIGDHMPVPLPRPGDRQNPRSLVRSDRLEYSEVVPIEPVGASSSGFELLKLLRSYKKLTAVELTLSRLATTVAGVDSSLFPDASGPRFSTKPLATRYGPNIVVVYSGNNVDDLATIWHLRALHGFPSGFPLAVPLTDDIAEVIDTLASHGARKLWGLAGGAAALISNSVDKSTLREIAKNIHDFDVVSCDDVMTASHGCLIDSTDEIHYNDGQAEVVSFGPTEIEILGRTAIHHLGGWMKLTTVVTDQMLPPSRTMRRAGYHVGEYLQGYMSNVYATSETVEVFQPSGLEVLTALAADHNQKVVPSDAGLAAAQLMELAGPQNLSLLASPSIMGMIYELTRRGDSSTVKNQLRNYLKSDDDKVDEARYQLLAERLDSALSKPEAEEVFYKTLSAIREKSQLSREAAENWVRWACQRGLLLRGFEAVCDRCRHKQWRPFADAVPELVCHGCGYLIPDPYGSDSVVIRYRSSETLLRAMNKDVLSHILALRYLVNSFAGMVSNRSNVFGAYPGLNILGEEAGKIPAEADVAIILGNGKWIVGECKNTATGLRQSDLDKLWNFADRVDAAATFVATLDPSEKCGDIWRCDSSPAGRPHFALTAEHLYELNPRRGADSPSFHEWRSEYSSEDGTKDTLDKEFRTFLEKRDDDRWSWKRAPWLRE